MKHVAWIPLGLVFVGSAWCADELRPASFTNPIAEGADPSVVQDGDRYLWCQSEGNRGISIWRSDRLTSLGRKHVVWNAPPSGPFSREVWAPELVKLRDRWYIYFAASDGKNENHRTYVLASQSPDPLGNYRLHGPLATGDDVNDLAHNIWAIDMVPLEHAGRLYALWSGWSKSGSDRQFLYIAPMKSPTALSGNRVQLCQSDDYLWERTEETGDSRGLHEAPQVLQRDGRTFVVYSCAASWLPTYKLGMLELTGDDPLDPRSWEKHPEPVFQSSGSTFGVGHGGFVRSPDQSQWWHIFHAKVDRRGGWRRAIFVQPMDWSPSGLPQFGRPVAVAQPIPFPSGTPVTIDDKPRKTNFADAGAPDHLDLYGHHQRIDWRTDGLALGVNPEDPVNDYRCGEKALLRDRWDDDVEVTATFTFKQGDRDAGVLFRVGLPAVGYDAQQGYFAGLIPGRGTVILGKTDGRRWHHLIDAPVEFDASRRQHLRVRALGDQIEVFVNQRTRPSIRFRDASYRRGTVGVRVVDTHALFSTLSVRPL